MAAKKPQPATLRELQEAIHYETYKAILEDLKNPEKRTPALIQAALKGIQQAGIELDPTAVPVEGSSMGQIKQLARDLPPILDGDEAFDEYR